MFEIDKCFIIEQGNLRCILNDNGQLKVLKFLLNNTNYSYRFDNYTTLAKKMGFKTKSGVWKAIHKLKGNDLIAIIDDKFYGCKTIVLKNQVCIYNDYT